MIITTKKKKKCNNIIIIIVSRGSGHNVTLYKPVDRVMLCVGTRGIIYYVRY